jgi:hypothetical protein
MEKYGENVLVTGVDLRYLLTWCLVEAGAAMSVGDLVRSVDGDGFVVVGQANKTIADALRWEIGHGRVVRVGRGLYRSGAMPRQTKSRIRTRVTQLRVQAFSRRGEHDYTPGPFGGAWASGF